MDAASAQAMKTVNLVTQELETQSLNAIVSPSLRSPSTRLLANFWASFHKE